jgi:hypothetical protein
MGTPFGIESPAKNIYELVEYLDSIHSNTKYYRGQTKLYPSNAPSALRPAAKLTSATNEWVELDQDYWANAPDKLRAQGDLRTILLTVYGRALGNLLAQQYGITSDGYDLTSEVTVAAFFATRRWPKYKHFEGSKDNSIGVIYRFNISDQSALTAETIDLTRKSLYYALEGGQKIWFKKVFQYRDMVIYANSHNKKIMSLPKLLKKEKIGDASTVELVRPTSYIRGETFKKLFVEFAKKAKFRGSPEDEYGASRSFAQHGGVLFPAFKHTALISKHLDIIRHDGKNLYPRNPVAISLGATHVYELNSNPYVEKFFFLHSDQEMEIGDLNALWPGKDVDPIYHYMYVAAENICKNYLRDYASTPDDFEKGLIDRGFKPD